LTTPAEEDEDEEAKKHLYAQRDTPVLSVQRKDNPHGLGYVPGTTLHSSRPDSGPKLAGSFILYSTYSSLRRLIGGFGLGALNDADEDDLDVYDSMLHPSSSSKQRVAYDHAQGADDDETVFIGSRRAKADAGKHKGVDVRLQFFFVILISSRKGDETQLTFPRRQSSPPGLHTLLPPRRTRRMVNPLLPHL
jgi:hypothetical protein